jgi:hypothetical protein
MTTKTATDLELAQAFARAYRDIDGEAMRGLLAPSARIRMLIPRGLIELHGADALIDALRKLAEKWPIEEADEPEVELLAENLLKTGRIVSVGYRLRLRSASGESTANMVVKHLLAIADGRIALVDELCSGVMPQPAS